MAPKADATPVATSAPTAPAFPFPTEVIQLPSQGHFYTRENPLSEGSVEIKHMTAREEDILTSQSYIKRGIVLTKLLEALVVTPGVDISSMLVTDANAVLIAARVIGYGPEYETKVECPQCEETIDHVIDLSEINSKDIDLTQFEAGVNEFEVVLPRSGKKVLYKLLSMGDDRLIQEETEAVKRMTKGQGGTKEVTIRLKHVIVAIDGERDRRLIANAVENLPIFDIRELRKEIAKIYPDLDMNFDFTCNSCGNTARLEIPMGPSFFWPDAGT